MHADDDCISEMMYADTKSYLPDDILAKVDRAAMSVSLETRVPLLDHRLVEFAWTLPMHMKVRNGDSKWLLKQLAYRYVPAQMLDRPKAGFGVPVSDWIRGPLRDWAESLIGIDRLNREGYLNAKLVQTQWRQHIRKPMIGDERHWQLLAFQAWLADVSEG